MSSTATHPQTVGWQRLTALMWDRFEAWMLRTVRFNPAVTVLELRTRLRERRAYGQMLVSGLATSATALIVYAIASKSYPYEHENLPVGGIVFLCLAMAQLTIMLLIVPGYAAAVLTMEREKGTLELVQASLLTPTDVVTGKLLAVLAYTGVLLLTSLPVASWCFMVGGLDLVDIVLGYSYMAVVSLGAISLGLLVAAFLRKTAAAFSATTGVLLIGLGGIPAALIALAAGVDNLTGGTEGTLIAKFWVVLVCGSALAWWLYVMTARSLDPTAKSLATTAVQARLPAALGAISISGVMVFVTGSGVLATSSEGLIGALAILHPHAALLGIVRPDMAGDLLTGLGLDPAWSSAKIWAAATPIALIAGLMLWYMATMAFRWSWRRELRQAAVD